MFWKFLTDLNVSFKIPIGRKDSDWKDFNLKDLRNSNTYLSSKIHSSNIYTKKLFKFLQKISCHSWTTRTSRWSCWPCLGIISLPARIPGIEIIILLHGRPSLLQTCMIHTMKRRRILKIVRLRHWIIRRDWTFSCFIGTWHYRTYSKIQSSFQTHKIRTGRFGFISLWLHSTILEPNFDLSFGELEPSCNLNTTSSSQILIAMEFLFKFQRLVFGICLSCPFWAIFAIYIRKRK